MESHDQATGRILPQEHVVSIGDVSGIMVSAILQILILSGPILLVALVVGLVIAILQDRKSVVVGKSVDVGGRRIN